MKLLQALLPSVGHTQKVLLGMSTDGPTGSADDASEGIAVIVALVGSSTDIVPPNAVGLAMPTRATSPAATMLTGRPGTEMASAGASVPRSKGTASPSPNEARIPVEFSSAKPEP